MKKLFVLLMSCFTLSSVMQGQHTSINSHNQHPTVISQFKIVIKGPSVQGSEIIIRSEDGDSYMRSFANSATHYLNIGDNKEYTLTIVQNKKAEPFTIEYQYETTEGKKETRIDCRYEKSVIKITKDGITLLKQGAIS